jgi:hypothetical protein
MTASFFALSLLHLLLSLFRTFLDTPTFSLSGLRQANVSISPEEL